MKLSSFLLIFSLYCLKWVNSSSDSDWCRFLQSNPEPDFLFYNRMGKAGSTTMQSYFEKMSKANHFVTVNMERDFWVDFEIMTSKRSEFVKKMTSVYLKHGNKTVLANGHWAQFVFEPTHFLSKRIEYIQLIRNCSTLARSIFLYSLFESESARSAAANQLDGNLTRIGKLLNVTNSSTSIRDCLQSDGCVESSHLLSRFESNELSTLCGVQCHTNHSSAYGNLYSPHVFTVIGAIEYFDEYLTLLECAYPNILRGIVALNKKDKVKARPTQIPFQNVSGLTKFISHDLCQPGESKYMDVYSEAIRLLLNRYNYVIRNKATCCRKKRRNL
jgi:hypothetical protein